MPGLQATGTLRYNNYVFDGATHVAVDVEFVRDESNRTTIAHRHILTVEAVVSGSDGILPDLDTTMENIRRRLGEHGKELVFINKGFGTDLIINTGLVQDIDYGPKPLMLSWIPLGDDKAAQIVWKVETTIPVCGVGRKARRNGLVSINYGAAYTIDASGNTQRTLAGSLSIVNGAGIKDTADRYRTWFSPLPIPGFARTQSWATSTDKRQLSFVITDTEIPSPNPYPKQIVSIEGSHRVSWRMGKEAGLWQNHITATIEGDANLSAAQCWQIFLTIVDQRRRLAKERSGKSVFLLGVDVEENLFGRPQSFSVQYQVLGKLADFIGVSGLWRPLGTDWNQWAFSLGGSIFNQRGAAQLQEVAANDVIVNLCGPPIPVIPNNLHFQRRFIPQEFKGTIQNYVPDNGDETFLGMKNEIETHSDAPVAQQSLLQRGKEHLKNWNVFNPPPGTPPSVTRGTEERSPPAPGDNLYGAAPYDSLPGGSGDDIIQVSGEPSYGIRIRGGARRAGFPIPAPYIKSVGSRGVIEVRSQYGQRQLCEAFGVPVYEAWWQIDYLIDGPPGTINALPYWGG